MLQVGRDQIEPRLVVWVSGREWLRGVNYGNCGKMLDEMYVLEILQTSLDIRPMMRRDDNGINGLRLDAEG